MNKIFPQTPFKKTLLHKKSEAPRLKKRKASLTEIPGQNPTPQGKVMPMERFLLELACQILAGILVALITRNLR